MKYFVQAIDMRIGDDCRVKWTGYQRRTWEPCKNLTHLKAYQRFRDKEARKLAPIMLTLSVTKF